MGGARGGLYGSSSSLTVGAVSVFEAVEGFPAGFFAGGLFAETAGACAVDFLFCGGFPTVRYLRILSSFFGPIPLIARRSSRGLNAPHDFPVCRIFSAVARP